MPTFLLALLLGVAGAVQVAGPLSGTVVDASGAPIPDATVRLEASGSTIGEFRTTGDGHFEFMFESAGPVRIIVTALGFAQATQAVSPGGGSLQITLQPAPFYEAVNVTSSRTDVPKADPTVTMTVISSTELLSSAPVSIDDALKMVPGFSLFRRTSSRTANPTTHGVALRGIGGTAQSRSLVLADGVPLNDAFGGWVYWDKVPQVAIDRIEVQRGSGSDLYGADAVGGVVQLITLRPARPSGRALVEGGGLGTGRVSLFAGARTHGWRYSGAGEWFKTEGYISVAEKQDPGIAPRGPIDSEFGSTHRSGLASAGYQATTGWRFDLSGNFFSEDRTNGSPVAINNTDSRQGSGELAGGVGGGLLSVHVFGGTQKYRQTFSTINATRTSEALNRDQHIPSNFVGVGGQWIRLWGRQTLLFGAESRHVKGSSIETPYVQGRPSPTIDAGGTQRPGSAFVQDTLLVNDRFTLVLGAHGDTWHSESKTTGFSKTSGSFNPRVSASYRLGDSGVTIRGSAYQGFRAPTLNELYRSFSTGNVQTRPNEALIPERLTGGDAGVLMTHGRVSARVTGYLNVLDDAITSITLSTTPTAIIRQRANADKLRAAGVEVEADVRLPASFYVGFTSGFVNSQYKGDTPLRDKTVPQVASYNIGVNLRYTHQAWTASSQFRVTGPQFEDDQNVFTLRRATVLDVFASRSVARKISAFVAVENLFDEIYDVGRTPILTTGLPRAARAGVLIALP